MTILDPPLAADKRKRPLHILKKCRGREAPVVPPLFTAYAASTGTVVPTARYRAHPSSSTSGQTAFGKLLGKVFRPDACAALHQTAALWTGKIGAYLVSSWHSTCQTLTHFVAEVKGAERFLRILPNVDEPARKGRISLALRRTKQYNRFGIE